MAEASSSFSPKLPLHPLTATKNQPMQNQHSSPGLIAYPMPSTAKWNLLTGGTCSNKLHHTVPPTIPQVKLIMWNLIYSLHKTVRASALQWMRPSIASVEWSGSCLRDEGDSLPLPPRQVLWKEGHQVLQQAHCYSFDSLHGEESSLDMPTYTNPAESSRMQLLIEK